VGKQFSKVGVKLMSCWRDCSSRTTTCSADMLICQTRKWGRSQGQGRGLLLYYMYNHLKHGWYNVYIQMYSNISMVLRLKIVYFTLFLFQRIIVCIGSNAH